MSQLAAITAQLQQRCISQAEAATELLRRRRARQYLLDYAQYMQPEYAAGAHHRTICDALERVERGEIDRLMIFAPPRHGKSQLASLHFPAWYLGRNPDKQIITSTYAADFAADFGRGVRNALREPEYKALFKTELADDSQAAGRWHTKEGGVYIATGVGGSLTGRGASVAIIDDFCKNREEADSEVYREKVWSWYTSTLYTRLMPGGSVVVICTRWHEADLVGRLLDAQDTGGDKWHIISLKAIDDDGNALWPEWYPLPALDRIRAAIGPRDWSALYQQNPQPDSGTFFQKQWFLRYVPSRYPEHLSIYMTSDFAVKADSGDYTEHAVWGIDSQANIWALDWWSGQTSSDVWIDELLRLVRKHNPLCYFGERGVIQHAIEPLLKRSMRDKSTFCRLEWLTSAHDKPTRARAFQARAASAMVHVPICDWGDRLVDQLIRFPAGKHDDAIDACSMIGRVLDEAHPAMLPAPEQPQAEHDRYKGHHEIEPDNNWRVT